MAVENILEMIADYADNEALEYHIFRDETVQPFGVNSKYGANAQWVVRFPFRDERGPFSAYYHIDPAEFGRGIAARHALRKALDKAITDTKTKRNRSFLSDVGRRVAA